MKIIKEQIYIRLFTSFHVGLSYSLVIIRGLGLRDPGSNPGSPIYYPNLTRILLNYIFE